MRYMKNGGCFRSCIAFPFCKGKLAPQKKLKKIRHKVFGPRVGALHRQDDHVKVWVVPPQPKKRMM